MMENYFNVFKSPSIQFDSNYTAASVVSRPVREEVIEKLGSGFNNAAGVKVTISQAAQESAATTLTTNSSDISIYEPKDGVMVKKDSADYLSRYQDMDKRISMVEVLNNGKAISSDSLKETLSNIESNPLNMSSLIKNGGGFDSDSLELNGRVELGNIRGGDFLFDQDGNIIGQKYIGIVDIVQNQSQVNLNLTTVSGIDIKIDLLLTDEMSRQGATGVSRDINFSYSALDELSDEEIIGLNSILNSLQGAFSSFHGDYSITQEEADSLIKSMSGESEVFSSINAQLKMEKGEISRVISASMDEGGVLAIDSKEKGMDIAYDVSSLWVGILQKHMGDSQTNVEVNRKIAEANNTSSVYKSAIESTKSESPLGYGEYISSFFDPAAGQKPV